MLSAKRIAAWCVVAGLGLFLAQSRVAAEPAAQQITVSAAASLKDAITAIDQDFHRAHPDIDVTPNFGGSGTLQLQIEQGAPVDVFISAAPQQMDALAAKNLLLPGTRVDLLKNELVLIAPKSSSVVKGFDDLKKPEVRVIAVGDPRSVPAGTYARQVLTALAMYDALKSKMTFATDVRQVLADVETGSAEAGLVYATDAAISSNVRVVADAPAGTHQPIIYPAAVLQASMNPQAGRAFVHYLSSPSARAVFAKYGFRPAEK